MPLSAYLAIALAVLGPAAIFVRAYLRDPSRRFERLARYDAHPRHHARRSLAEGDERQQRRGELTTVHASGDTM
ncbi:MAG TPA: hypothetical protein VD768_08720 [Sphingomicrobium sp.]|nr:hypothetical protein [Sphingomicrobium sp.]